MPGPRGFRAEFYKNLSLSFVHMINYSFVLQYFLTASLIGSLWKTTRGMTWLHYYGRDCVIFCPIYIFDVCYSVCWFLLKLFTGYNPNYLNHFCFSPSLGWLPIGQPSTARLLGHRPLWVRKHPQGLCLQAAFQVPRLLLPIREWIHIREVPNVSSFKSFLSSSIFQGLIKKPFLCPLGGWRSSAALLSPQVELVVWTAKRPTLNELAHLVSIPFLLRVASARPVPLRTLCFSFLRISGTFVHVSMHIWCFLML